MRHGPVLADNDCDDDDDDDDYGHDDEAIL